MLLLHFTICSLVREVTLPQWYTEEEFEALEDDFTFVAVECNWLQDLLESKGELPGFGFNIIKFHDFLSIPSIIREMGCIMSADTSSMEMRMKEIKHHDKFVKKTRRDKGHGKVFLRAVAQDIDDAYQAWKNATSQVESNSSSIEQEEPGNGEDSSSNASKSDNESLSDDEYTFDEGTFNVSQSKRKVGAWREARYVLERGVNGPALNTVSALSSLAEGEDIVLGTMKFNVRELIVHEDPTTFQKSNMYLLPGHCVQLKDGRFAQVILPKLLASESNESSSANAVLSFFKYVNPEVRGGNHPVIPVPFLERADTALMTVNSIARRVHVYPKWRPGIDNSPILHYHDQFFVNPFVSKVRRGPAHPLVCVTCPNPSCIERVPMPLPPERQAKCSACGHVFIWF